MSKSPDAFRTISEVAEWLGVQAHVLRFWESKFTQVKPIKRAGGRRYYRPADMLLLGGIRKLLHEDGMSIKEVQGILRDHGIAHVSDLSHSLDMAPAGEEGESTGPAARSADSPAEPFTAEPTYAQAEAYAAGQSVPPAGDKDSFFEQGNPPVAEAESNRSEPTEPAALPPEPGPEYIDEPTPFETMPEPAPSPQELPQEDPVSADSAALEITDEQQDVFAAEAEIAPAELPEVQPEEPSEPQSDAMASADHADPGDPVMEETPDMAAPEAPETPLAQERREEPEQFMMDLGGPNPAPAPEMSETVQETPRIDAPLEATSLQEDDPKDQTFADPAHEEDTPLADAPAPAQSEQPLDEEIAFVADDAADTGVATFQTEDPTAEDSPWSGDGAPKATPADSPDEDGKPRIISVADEDLAAQINLRPGLLALLAETSEIPLHVQAEVAACADELRAWLAQD